MKKTQNFSKSVAVSSETLRGRKQIAIMRAHRCRHRAEALLQPRRIITGV